VNCKFRTEQRGYRFVSDPRNPGTDIPVPSRKESVYSDWIPGIIHHFGTHQNRLCAVVESQDKLMHIVDIHNLMRG
jgi:hypothetical protein